MYSTFCDGVQISKPMNSMFITSQPQPKKEALNKRPSLLFGATLRAPISDGFQVKLSIPQLPQLDLSLSNKEIVEQGEFKFMSLVREPETKQKITIQQETPSCKLCGLRHTLQSDCKPVTESSNSKPTVWNIMPHLKS